MKTKLCLWETDLVFTVSKVLDHVIITTQEYLSTEQVFYSGKMFHQLNNHHVVKTTVQSIECPIRLSLTASFFHSRQIFYLFTHYFRLTDISTAITIFNQNCLFTSALYISYTMVVFKAQKKQKQIKTANVKTCTKMRENRK